MKLPERLLNKIIKQSDCWIWQSSIKPNGYGTVHWEGKTRNSHKLVYELLVGPVPEGLELDHLCRNRACVNPAHLEPVTRRENIVRGDNFIADYMKQSTCKNKHSLVGDNLYVTPQGYRKCRECQRMYLRNHRKLKEAM